MSHEPTAAVKHHDGDGREEADLAARPDEQGEVRQRHEHEEEEEAAEGHGNAGRGRGMDAAPFGTTMRVSNVVRRQRLRLAACLLLFFPGALAAQASGDASGSVFALSHDLRADQAAHLWRVGAWGAANVAGGLALIALSDAESEGVRRAFGIQSAAWGAVNVGIAAVGLARGPGAASGDWAAAFGAENGYAGVLLVNLGLNVAYSAVGATMVIASHRGVSNAEAWRGHGAALVLQGAGLLVLDGIAYLGSRQRLGALVDLADSATLSAGLGGVRLVVGL